MKIIITGGAGFIGANLVHHLVRNHPEDDFTVLDKLTYAGNLANLDPVMDRPNFRFVKGDICDPDLAGELMTGVDLVANLAAESHVDRSIDSAADFIRTNISGTQNLIEAARKAGVKRFVQISTDEVYGTLGPNDPPFSETTPLAPNSPYAASKASADLLVRAAVETHGFPGMITRCSNNYGPYQFPEKLIPLMLANALEGKPLPVYGDGMQVRDWIHVNDHCRGVEMVLYQGRPGQIYNFGGACEMANLHLLQDLLTALAEATGREVEEFTGLITHVTDRPGHDRRYAMSFDLTQERLGWQPRMTIQKGLEQTVAWYLANEPWWQEIRSGDYLEYYERQYGRR